MKPRVLVACASLVSACTSETARPPALGSCVSQTDASCVSPAVTASGPDDAGSGSPAVSGSDGAALAATNDGAADSAGRPTESGVAVSADDASTAKADAASPIGVGSE